MQTKVRLAVHGSSSRARGESARTNSRRLTVAEPQSDLGGRIARRRRRSPTYCKSDAIASSASTAALHFNAAGAPRALPDPRHGPHRHATHRARANTLMLTDRAQAADCGAPVRRVRVAPALSPRGLTRASGTQTVESRHQNEMRSSEHPGHRTSEEGGVGDRLHDWIAAWEPIPSGQRRDHVEVDQPQPESEYDSSQDL